MACLDHRPTASLSARARPGHVTGAVALGAALTLGACATTPTPPTSTATTPTATAPALSGAPRAARQTVTIDMVDISRLESLAMAEDYQALVDRLKAPVDAQQRTGRAMWMEDRLRSGVASSVLAEPYARTLMDMGRSQDTYFWYLYGTITLQIDAARCADRSAPLRKISSWATATSDIAADIDQLSAAAKARLGAAALAYEDITSDYRLTDRWLCSQGVDYWNAYYAKYPERRSTSRAQLPRDTEIEVYAVPEREWQSKRARIRAIYADALTTGTFRAAPGRALSGHRPASPDSRVGRTL